MAVTDNPNIIDLGALSLSPSVYALGSTTSFFDTPAMYMLSTSIDSGASITTSIDLDAVASATLSGSIEITFASQIYGKGSAFASAASGSLVRSNNINLNSSAISASSEALFLEGRTLTLDEVALLFSVDATLSQSSIIVPVAGDEYLVVNLRTKSHTTYNDANNNASMLTGLLDFGSSVDKTIPDAYLISRSGDDVTFVMRNDEETERKYVVSYESDVSQKMKNKKIKAAKGLKGPQWQIGVEASSTEPLYVEGIDLLVGELKRRV